MLQLVFCSRFFVFTINCSIIHFSCSFAPSTDSFVVRSFNDFISDGVYSGTESLATIRRNSRWRIGISDFNRLHMATPKAMEKRSLHRKCLEETNPIRATKNSFANVNKQIETIGRLDFVRLEPIHYWKCWITILHFSAHLDCFVSQNSKRMATDLFVYSFDGQVIWNCFQFRFWLIGKHSRESI